METIPAIESSLDDLENVLEPLLEKDLSEIVSKLDTLQKAKFQVVLPYVVNSLVASYMKIRDIDPGTHPVSSELERIGQYLSKIQSAANGSEQRTLTVDQQAATRFIKHAIQGAGNKGNHRRFNNNTGVSVKTVVTTSASGVDPQSSIVDAGLTTAALAKTEERKKALAESDDSDLSLDDDGLMVDEVIPPTTSKSEWKRKQNQDDTSNSKKKRKGIDPWTGFEDSTTTVVTQNTETNKAHDTLQDVSTPIASKPPRKPRHKKKRQQPQVIDAESGSNEDNSRLKLPQTATALSVESSGSNTPAQRKSKKKRKEKKESRTDAPISISSD